MKISIVIPCYNHGIFLLEALESLSQCDRDLYEVIIVNDGSTDRETISILNHLSSQGLFIFNQSNRGLANARNQGIKLAETEYILPLDCDNKIRSNYLTKSIEILKNNPTIGVVYSDVSYFGEKTLVWALPDFDLPHLLVRNYIDACAVFRKEVWQTCGGYDEEIPDRLGYEDWDFWLTAAEQGWHFYHLPEVCYDYRVRSDSMVQSCKLPANQSKLVKYICAKHQNLYAQYLPYVLAEKELLLFNQINANQDLQTQIIHLENEVSALEKTIEWVRSSKFWQLRKTWIRLKHLYNRVTTTD